jgi:hypothetical protein
MAKKIHRRSLFARESEWLFAGYSPRFRDIVTCSIRRVMNIIRRWGRMTCSRITDSPPRTPGMRNAKNRLTAARTANNKTHGSGDAR